MRPINLIVIHCSATKPSHKTTAQHIDEWHRHNGWNGIGYHYFIPRDGWIQIGRQLNEVGAHAKGYNDFSIGICLAGGINENEDPEDNFSDKQYIALYELLETLLALFPGCKILGHGELPNSTKYCPCFRIDDKLEAWGLSRFYGGPDYAGYSIIRHCNTMARLYLCIQAQRESRQV